MASDDAKRFWGWLDQEAHRRQSAVELRARFSGDPSGQTPLSLVLEQGEPRVRLSPAARALFDRIDPEEVRKRHADPAEGETWLAAFEEARSKELLTPNAACRVVLGPHYRP